MTSTGKRYHVFEAINMLFESESDSNDNSIIGVEWRLFECYKSYFLLNILSISFILNNL